MEKEPSPEQSPFMNKWGLIIKAAGITAVLLIVRLIFDYLNYDVLTLTNLLTSM